MHRINGCAATIILVITGLFSSAQAATFELFDASLGTLPGPLLPGPLFFGDFGISQTYITDVGIDFDSTGAGGNDNRGGYTNTIPFLVTPPILDRSTGVNLDFDLQVIAEAHGTVDRSGFSIILLTSDLLGVELSFWTDTVWAKEWSQEDDFTHVEEALFDTTNALRTNDLTSYSLQILGSDYSVFADGGLLLSGELRNYSEFGSPYDIENYIFIGDNTRSAQAHVVLGDVTLTTSVVPLPPSIVLALAAFLTTLTVRRNREDVVQAPIT